MSAESGAITKDAREFITKNCSMTGEELRQIIKKKYGVDVSVQAVLQHAKNARIAAEESTKTADMCLAKTIAEKVNVYAPKVLSRYEKEMERISKILDGEDPSLIIPVSQDGTRDNYWYEKYVKLYDSLGKSYLALRPPVQTVRVENALDPDVAAIDSWTDEQMDKFEAFKRAMAKEEKEL